MSPLRNLFNIAICFSLFILEVTFVTFVDILLFSSFSDIPGASQIKTCDKSPIKKHLHS